jgi:hypothetical protein
MNVRYTSVSLDICFNSSLLSFVVLYQSLTKLTIENHIFQQSISHSSQNGIYSTRNAIVNEITKDSQDSCLTKKEKATSVSTFSPMRKS